MILTCLTWEWSRGSSEELMEAVLLQYAGVGVSWGSSMDVSSIQIQIHSFAASKGAMYLALQDDTATVFCLHVVQGMPPDPREHIYPLMLCLM